MARSHLSEHIQDRDNLKGFQQERLLIEVASLIYQTMKTRGITRKALADALGVTKGRITQYLGGERNLTLRTLADIFTAMDSMVVFQAEELSIEADDWQEIPDLADSVRLQPLSRIWEQCLDGGDPSHTLAS
jgi:transcriptional regulator with XRE-family HTH domain